LYIIHCIVVDKTYLVHLALTIWVTLYYALHVALNNTNLWELPRAFLSCNNSQVTCVLTLNLHHTVIIISDCLHYTR